MPELREARVKTESRRGPSALDLVRLSSKPVFPSGGEALYRQIARLTELAPGREVLDAACGRGLSTLFLAEAYGIEGAGVDPNAALIREAEARARDVQLEGRVHFQQAALDDLPYRDEVFDVAIGEIGLAVPADPAAAVRELVRVTRPMGCVVLIQLIWTGNVAPERQKTLVEHLGARPLILVEWKQLLRDAGVVEISVEDWSDEPSPYNPDVRSPFPDLSRIFSVREKIAILRRALRRWGWDGVRGAIAREQEVNRLLSRERALGLSLIKGTRWPEALP